MTDLDVILMKYAADSREHPLIIAEAWGFPLQHYERDDGTLYAAQDWVSGLITATTRRAGEVWRQMDQRRVSITPLPYKARDGKTYQRDFTDQRGLYLIAQQLRSATERPALAEIKAYLAAAGVFADDVRRTPDKAIDAGISQYERQGKPNTWIGERLDGKVSRKAFTAALDSAVSEFLTGRHYAQATDTIYTGLWNRTAAQLKGELNLSKSQSLRDRQPILALAYQRIAEETAALKLGERQEVTWQEARGIVAAVATLIGAQAQQTGNLLGFDLGTGKPLLED